MAKMYELRVARGAALLDAQEPDWWNGKDKPTIDLKTLNLGSTYYCVLGQVYGDYSDGLNELSLIDSSPYGFDIEDGGRALRQRYDTLGRRWRELITSRRRAAARA